MIFDLTKRKSGGGGGGDPYEVARTIADGSIERYDDASTTAFRKGLFENCASLKTIYAPGITSFSWTGTIFNLSTNSLQAVVFPSVTGDMSERCLQYCKSPIIDFGENFAGKIGIYAMQNATMDTLILRCQSIVVLNHIGSLPTPFNSGGTGGTIYIPKSLYDHLGDGTANDYKAATNWSTVDGYGTITWAKIEGSLYETQYADGTPIPTT